MRHLTAKAANAVYNAIDSHLATPVVAAHYEVDGCSVSFYRLNGHVFRCEQDLHDDERYVEELDGGELADFHHCRSPY